MIAGDVQRFWSTLSIHAASAVMEIGGENESALAAAESILEQGEKITRAGTPITSQTVRDAASKASVAILQNDDADSRVASAVAVAVIQKGTALLQEIKENKLDNKKEKQSLKSILTERNKHDNSSRTSSLTSRKSRNSSRGRKKNIMFHDMKKIRGSDSQNNRQDDNITISSISTFGFKQWDKYATEKESDSERNREPVRKKTSVVDKYATDSIFLNECVSTESSHTSGEPSQYSTDQSTIATESYHCLGKHSSPRKKEEDSLIPKYFSTAVGSLSSYNITKQVDSLAVMNAGASDISSMRRKEEELERKHAEFSAAAEALEKKIALAVAALEESGSSKTPKLVPDNVESNDIKTPRVSNRGGSTSTTKKKKPGVSNYYVASTATKKKTSRASNYGDKSTKADRTLQELTITTHANDNSIDDELTTPTGNQLQGRSVVGSTSGLFRIAEDTTEDAKDDTSKISDTRLQNVSDKNEGDEEKGIEDESIEVSLGKKSFKNKVKGFLQHKKKKVTWAATNAFKIIPARSNSRRMSAGKRLSLTLGRKSRGLKRRFSRSRSFDTEGSSGGRTELGHKVPELNTPPTTTNGVEVTKPLKDVEMRVVTFDDAVISAETEIPPNETSSTASGSMFSGRDSYSQASSKSGLSNYYSSPFARFLDQAFYSQPDHSIDEGTALTFSTSNSEAQSSIEAILEVDDISLVTDESYNSRKSHSTKGSGSKVGLRFS